MVAEVIKFPSSIPNSSFQPTQVGNSVSVVNTYASGVQQSNGSSQTEEHIEQTAQNIEVVRKAAEELNEFARQIQTSLKFSVDEVSGRSIITVTDSQTGDVIRQIPAKEILAVANLLREFTASDVDKVGLLLADQG